MTIQLIVNGLACLILFWVCGSFLLIGGQAKTLRQLAIQAGLLVTMVGAMSSGLAPYKYDIVLSWWTVTIHSGAAVVALGLYDSKFGIHEQIRHAVFAATEAPYRIRRWWRRSVRDAHHSVSQRHSKR